MAPRRIFLLALIIATLTAASMGARPTSRKQEVNAYDSKGAPEALHAEEGKGVAGASPETGKYANAILSGAASQAHIDAAKKNMKEAEVANTPEEAAVAKKAAARNIANAMAYASQGAAVAAPEAADATEPKEDTTISAAVDDSPKKDVNSKYAKAILSGAASKGHIEAAEKNMKEAEVAKTPEEAAVAKKAAARNIATAMAYASQGAAVAAPEAADATEPKEDTTISAAVDDSPKKDVNSKYAKAILSGAASKGHIEAAEKNMKEAEVAKTPEEAAVAKKAAARNIATAMAYASQGAAVAAPEAADATEPKEDTTISAAVDDSPKKDVNSKYAKAILSGAASKGHIEAAEKNMKEAEVAKTPEEAAVAKKAAARNRATAMAYASQGAAVAAPEAADATEPNKGATIFVVGDSPNKDVPYATPKDGSIFKV